MKGIDNTPLIKLFLSSSFKDVAVLFKTFAGKNLKGKTVTFIPTGSLAENERFYVREARMAFEELGLVVDELELTQASEQEIADKLKSNNYIYISGGNTFFLLQELKRTGADKILIEQIRNGKPYIGESAGSMIMSPNVEYVALMDDKTKAPSLKSPDALHMVDFYPVPHYTNYPFKKTVEKIVTAYGLDLDLRPITNHQAILVNGGDIAIVTNSTEKDDQ